MDLLYVLTDGLWCGAGECTEPTLVRGDNIHVAGQIEARLLQVHHVARQIGRHSDQYLQQLSESRLNKKDILHVLLS